ncbi:MAG: hypothetical protein WBA12_10295 [Catalinimonas sp.]
MRLLFCLLLIPALAACVTKDEEPDRGTFTVDIVGGDPRRVEKGGATFSDQGDDLDVVLVISSLERMDFNLPAGGGAAPLDLRSYAPVNLTFGGPTDAPRPGEVQVTFRQSNTAAPFLADSGAVVVTQATAERITATFGLRMGNVDGDTLRATGTFEAVPQ